MRTLGLIVCALVLAACTSTIGGEPRPGGLTAAAALGEFRTIDYCTMLDPAGDTPTSSFERCWVDEGAVIRSVGPLNADVDGDPYDYAGDLPPGVRIRTDTRPLPDYCARWVGFADDMWLMVTNVDPAPSADQCQVADDMVADVLAAVEKRQVRHVAYAQDSFGGLDPCTLLDVPEVEALVGARTGEPSPDGHSCLRGHIGLRLKVGIPNKGTTETVGGRVAVVEAIGVFCMLTVDRPLPDRPGLMEQATLTGIAVDGDKPGNGADVCPETRAIAEVVFPELPQ
jgi:hypothetical protein